RCVSAAPARTMSAPSGPPIQFHHSVSRRLAMLGVCGRRINIAIVAVSIVPRIEKYAAQSGLSMFWRNLPFAAEHRFVGRWRFLRERGAPGTLWGLALL